MLVGTEVVDVKLICVVVVLEVDVIPAVLLRETESGDDEVPGWLVRVCCKPAVDVGVVFADDGP